MSEELIQCPYCGDHPSHFHCSLNFEKSLFFCYFCGAGGTLAKLVRDHPAMKERVWLFSDIRLPRQVDSQKAPMTFTMVHNSEAVMAGKARQYLRKRGLKDSEMVQFQASISSKLPWYVIFPHDFGPEVFWAGRAFTEGARYRWFFPKSEDVKAGKSEVVWGITRQPRDGEIWIAEGIFDAIAVRGVAVFGKKPSNDQLRMILALRPKRVVIAFDRDALEEARELQNTLRAIVPTAISLPKHKDYGELLEQGWRRPDG